jgi:hypothetical protein
MKPSPLTGSGDQRPGSCSGCDARYSEIVKNVISITPIIPTEEQFADRQRPRRAGAKP